MINLKKTIQQNIYWLPILLFTLFAYSNHFLNSDEGLVLSMAWDIYNGKKLYYDIFSFVAPGSFYLIAFIWKIFGVSYFTARYFSAIAIFLSALGIYKISTQFINKKYNFLAPVLFVISAIYWPIINYHTYNLFFLIWTIYFSIQSLKEKSLKHSFLSGLFLSLAIIFLQHTGIAVLGGIILFWLFQAVKEKNSFYLKQLSVFFIPVLLLISVLFIFWSPALLFKNLIVFPFFNYEEIAAVPYTFIYIFLFFLAIFFIILKNEKKLEYYFIFFIQIILLFSTYSLADHFHVIKSIFPIYALMPIAIVAVKKYKLYLQSALYFTSAIIIIIIITPSLVFLLQWQKSFSSNKVNLIDQAKKICANAEYIYAGPFLPSYYFELRKKNPSSNYWLITNHHTKKQFEETLTGLQKYQPQCVILNYSMVEKYHYNKNNPVDNYILNNYNQIKSINSFLFFQKNDIQ